MRLSAFVDPGIVSCAAGPAVDNGPPETLLPVSAGGAR
jgi:hypothetical protein